MEKLSCILRQDIEEQIAIEEQLCQTIEQQLSEVDERVFPEARKVLIKAKEVLTQNFKPLNELLDELEQAVIKAENKHSADASAALHVCYSGESGGMHVSKILRDDYSDLNLIAMGNIMLHTTALALKHKGIATAALEHLQNLAPLVRQIHELVPHVVTKELLTQTEDVDPSIGHMAWENVQFAWQKSL